MLTHSPLPKWNTVFRAFFTSAYTTGELVAPWQRQGETGGLLAGSAWSFALIAQWRMAVEGSDRICIWFPDFFCNSALVPLRSLNARIVFYKIDANLEADSSSLQELISTSAPDIVITTHYFGQPRGGNVLKEFCKRNKAWLIEDAAHVLMPITGVGSFGDFVLYSPHKHLPIPDGGIVIVRTKGPSQLDETIISAFGDPKKWHHQLKQLQESLRITDFEHILKPYTWLVKRLMQKCGFGFLMPASYLPFKESTEIDSGHLYQVKFYHPAISQLSRRLLSCLIPYLPDIARKRQCNQLLWDQIMLEPQFNRFSCELTSRPNLREWIPYLAGYTFEKEHASEAYWEIAGRKLPVSTWPDLPPEVVNENSNQSIAWNKRHTRLYLPVHQSTRLDKLVKKHCRTEAYRGNKIEVKWCQDKLQWQDYIVKAGKSNLLQTWEYGEAKAKEGGWDIRRAVFLSDHDPIGITQILIKKIGIFFTLARINRGPLWLRDVNIEEKEQVFRLLSIYGNIRKGCILLIAPTLSLNGNHLALLHRIDYNKLNRRAWESIWLDLSMDLLELRKKLDGKWRNRLSFAEKTGMVCESGSEEALFQWMLERYQETMTAKGFVGPSVSLLREIHQLQTGTLLLFRAIHNGKPIAGICVAKHGAAATYLIGWNGEVGRSLKANQFLLWNAMSQLKDSGVVWFDLGGIDEDATPGISAFKLGCNGERYELVGEFIKWKA